MNVPPNDKVIQSQIETLKTAIRNEDFEIFSYILMEYRRTLTDFYSYYIENKFKLSSATAFRLYLEFFWGEAYQTKGKELLERIQQCEINSEDFEEVLVALEFHAYRESLEFLEDYQPQTINDEYLQDILQEILLFLSSIEKNLSPELKTQVFTSLDEYMESPEQEQYWKVERLLLQAEKEKANQDQEKLIQWLKEHWTSIEEENTLQHVEDMKTKWLEDVNKKLIEDMKSLQQDRTTKAVLEKISSLSEEEEKIRCLENGMGVSGARNHSNSKIF